MGAVVSEPLPDLFGTLSAFTKGIDGFDQVEQVRRGMWIHATTPRPPVGLTPYKVIHRQDKLEVRHYAAVGSEKRPPVVLVPSLINKAYILDLEPGRSLVEALAALGHDTYLVDWGTPGPEDAQEDVAYVVLQLLHRSIDRICRHAGSADAHLFGYCMGGTLVAMYAALRPQRVRTLTALAAPVKFAAGGRFRDFAQPDAIDLEEAIDGDGLVPVSVMKPAFRLLDPMGNWNKFLGIEAASKRPQTLARALARERWLEENVPVSGAFAREFIRCGYQEDRLLAGTWKLAGDAIDLGNIKCPTLVVACAGDFITPVEAASPLAEAVGGESKLEVLETGHIGVVVGGAGPKLFYPLLDAWFRGQSS